MNGETWRALAVITGYLVFVATITIWARRRLRDIGEYLRDIKNATTPDERRRLRGLSAPSYWLVDHLGVESLPPDSRSDVRLRRFPLLKEYREPAMSLRVLKLYETQVRYRSYLARVLQVSGAALYGVLASVAISQVAPQLWAWAPASPETSPMFNPSITDSLANVGLAVLVVTLLGAPFVTYAWFAQQRHLITRHRQAISRAIENKRSEQNYNT